jgi:hypothetical protein
MPLTAPVDTRGTTHTWRTDDPGRSIKLVGWFCWGGYACFANGISDGGPVYINVRVNGVNSRYAGPISLPDPAPGETNVVDFWAVDPNLSDNSGTLSAVLY